MNSKSFFVGALLSIGSSILASNAAFGWTLKENFDAVPEGAKPSTSNINWFSSTKATSQFKYGSSGRGAALSITGGTSGWAEFGAEGRLPTSLKEGDQLWYRVRTYQPASFNHKSETFALKFMRTRINKSDGSGRGHLDLYIRPDGDYLYQSEVYPNQINEKLYQQTLPSLWSGDLLRKDTWETYEVYHKFSTQPGTAMVRIWKNGKLEYQNNKWATLGSSSDSADIFLLFTYWNGLAPQSQTMYVDDLYLTNETPSTKDALGNPYIGMGATTTASIQSAPPAPPTLKAIQ